MMRTKMFRALAGWPVRISSAGILGVIAMAILLTTSTVKAEGPPPVIHRLDGSKITPQQIDAEVKQLMAKGRVPGLGLALIENGRIVYVQTYGFRSVENNQPLETDTVMYGASLTKLAFAYMV